MERSRPTTGTGQEEGAESLPGAKGGVESCMKIKTDSHPLPSAPLALSHARGTVSRSWSPRDPLGPGAPLGCRGAELGAVGRHCPSSSSSNK